MPDESRTETSELSPTIVFDALADQRRRYVLSSLNEHERRVSLADMADEVAVRENERPITEIPAKEVKQVSLSLWHWHIPNLVDVGIIEYNQDRQTVTLAKNSAQLNPLLKHVVAE